MHGGEDMTIIAAFFVAKLEKVLLKVIPKALQLIFVPLFIITGFDYK